MTRRRRMRLFALSLAAALAGVVALPALGAPDPMQSALRTWDAVIHDGRSGESLPLQVIVVLAAPPAVAIDSPQASKLAGSTQQLDLDALTAKGISMSIQYRFVNAINAVSATVRPDQLAQLRAAPEVAGVYPRAQALPGRDRGAAPRRAGRRRSPAVGRRRRRQGCSRRPARRPGRRRRLVPAPRGSRLERRQGQAAGPESGSRRGRSRHRDGRHRRRQRRACRPPRRRARGHAAVDPDHGVAARRPDGHDGHAAGRPRPGARSEWRRQPRGPRRRHRRARRRAVCGLRGIG